MTELTEWVFEGAGDFFVVGAVVRTEHLNVGLNGEIPSNLYCDKELDQFYGY